MTDFLWWVLTPSSVMLGLLILACLVGLAGKGRLAAVLVLPPILLFFALLFVPLDQYISRWLETQYEQPVLPRNIEAIVVLGGAVEWALSEEHEQLTLNNRGERVLAGLSLAAQFPEAELVFTGMPGNLLQYEYQRPGARGALIAPLLENRSVTYVPASRSTYEDALLTLEHWGGAPPTGPWVLVTSAQHMPRSMAVFEAQGMRPIAFPVDYTARLNPRASREQRLGNRLSDLDDAVRELGAVLVYRYLGRTTSF